MNVLVACEFSGRVRDAFRALGHEAWSCDLEGVEPLGLYPNYHLYGDVRWFLDGSAAAVMQWDLLIAFPPCTYLASSGLHWNGRIPGRADQTASALAFVRELLDAPIPQIALENPVGRISSAIRKPDQIIQPWQFGHPESKTTCLWLKGLPKLKPTDVLEPKYYQNADGTDYKDSKGKRYSATHFLSGRARRKVRWDNQTASGQNKLGPSPERAMLRSLTYPGIAAAMAAQWGRRTG